MSTHSSKSNQSKATRKANPLLIIFGILLLLAIVATTWWYFFASPQSKQQNSTTNTTQNQTVDTTPDTPDELPKDDIVKAGDVFKIPELGIQFELPEGLEGLEYEVREWNSIDDASGDTIKHESPYFVTSLLKERDTRCSYGAIGVITRVSPQIMESDNPIPAKYKKKLGESYYIFNGPTQPCSAEDDTNKLQSLQISLLLESLQTIELSRN